MIIRSLEKNDQIHVEEIMAGHPLQFPKFVIEKYPPRWNTFLTVQDYKLCGYYVALVNTCEVIGHAGYPITIELLFSNQFNIHC